MKLRIKSTIRGPEFVADPGQRVDWPDAFARALVAAGAAVSLEEPAEAAEAAAPEPVVEIAAAVPIVETAAVTPAPRRGPRAKA